MAFRVYPAEYSSIPFGHDFTSLPCEIVDRAAPRDAFFSWIDSDTLNEFRLPFSLLQIGTNLHPSYDFHVWMSLRPRFKEAGIAKALTAWNEVELVFNTDPVDALATFLRKHFIGLPYAD